MSRRVERLIELLRRELGTIVAREVDMKGVFITFTRITVSDDVHYADIYFTTLPEDAEGKALAQFNQNISSIQRLLNKRLRMRPVPKIRFHIDTEEREAMKIDRVIENLEHEA